MMTAPAAEAASVAAGREFAHHVAAAGEQHQRHQGEGHAEGEHHLGEHQGPGGVDAEGEHDQCGARVSPRRDGDGLD